MDEKYKPTNIHQIIPDCDHFDEDKHTILYMKKYGIISEEAHLNKKLTDQNKKTIESD